MGSINTEDLISSSELMSVEGVFNISPGTFDQELQAQSAKETMGECTHYAITPAIAHQMQYHHYVSAHLNQLPLTDMFDTEWGFDIALNSESAGKTSWMFSTKLNKVFVKINTTLNVTTSYNIVDLTQPLFIRAMIVYTSTNDLSEPVMKCPNHLEQSRRDKLVFPEHILRCSTLDTKYIGTDSGKLFKDKLAILIPMSNVASNEPLKLQLTCQNSCSGGMNRKMTSIVFTLENEYHDILGRRVLNFKVCSCPKRDKEKDEESCSKILPKKRKTEQTAPSTSKKVAISIPIVKQESDDTLSVNSDPNLSMLPSDLQSSAGLLELKREPQNCSINITFANLSLKNKALNAVYDVVAGEVQRTGDAVTHQSCLNDIQKQIGK